VIKEHANDLLYSYNIEKDAPIPVKPTPAEIIQKPPMRRTISRRLSFTRSVSRDLYRRSMSRSSLHDGATPIIVPEDEDNIIPENDNLDEDVFHSLTIKEEKELV
jgi:aromatic-L-amino-acid decarboxylase